MKKLVASESVTEGHPAKLCDQIADAIHGQSPDIAQGVIRALEVRDGKKQEIGAGNQGMVFGYASDELMPMSFTWPMPYKDMKPIYRQTAAYGHFGRKDLQVPWEWTDKVTVLRNALARAED